jgi:hypothetical protein
MLRQDVLMVKSIEGTPDDVAGSDDFVGGLRIIRKLKFVLHRLEAIDDSTLVGSFIRNFKLIQKEADLPHMRYGGRICIVQETPIAVEYAFEVDLHESRRTHILGGFELAWDSETHFRESSIQRSPQTGQSLGQES